MKSKVEKTILERAYSKGRRAKYKYGTNSPPLTEWIVSDMKEIGGDISNPILHEEWLEGFYSRTEHNPQPKTAKFSDSPLLKQKIRYKGKVRGIVLAYVKNSTIFIGYSLCNPADRYNDELGFLLARARAVPITKFDFNTLPRFDNRELDRVVRETISKVLGRAVNYFQQARLPFFQKDSGLQTVKRTLKHLEENQNWEEDGLYTKNNREWNDMEKF